MVDSVCQLGKYVATSDPGCRWSVCWSEIDRKFRSVPGQWKSIRSQKHSEVEVEIELEMGQNNKVKMTRVKVKQNRRMKGTVELWNGLAKWTLNNLGSMLWLSSCI